MDVVKVYSTPTCPYCIQAKDYLKKKNISFEDIDVTKDESKAQEMINLTGQMGVPVIVVNDEVIIGFDRNRLSELFD